MKTEVTYFVYDGASAHCHAVSPRVSIRVMKLHPYSPFVAGSQQGISMAMEYRHQSFLAANT